MLSLQTVILVTVLIFSVVVHEVAHAWQARREGDDTADRLGRITLNPLPHLDLFGSVIVPLLLASQGGIIFGWAKPVPVNPANYREYVAGDIRVSLAGIVSNLGLAVLATLLAGVVLRVTGGSGFSSPIFMALDYAIFINLILAFFNLIPIPPLDGSHVVAHALPAELAERYRDLGRYGLFIVMAFVFLAPGALNLLLSPVYFLQGLADQFIRLWI
ncbi:MAG: site-2 protease family protein [Gemmatimonadota bacterium]|nr:site-2 protease family protein [Gemmatimonadota bacterium]MDH3422469.1 site-2 protease family protein [Gemmatimonadota bacterium]